MRVSGLKPLSEVPGEHRLRRVEVGQKFLFTVVENLIQFFRCHKVASVYSEFLESKNCFLRDTRRGIFWSADGLPPLSRAGLALRGDRAGL